MTCNRCGDDEKVVQQRLETLNGWRAASCSCGTLWIIDNGHSLSIAQPGRTRTSIHTPGGPA